MTATPQENADRVTAEFVDAAKDALKDQLVSLVLYGSAAEGRVRATSDVNVIAVLKQFDPARIDALRGPMRTAAAAVGLNVMFLLENEVQPAMDAFAVKFADVLHRRKLLFGSDPFEQKQVSRASEIYRVRQVLLNHSLRLRQRYVVTSLRDEQLSGLVADSAGPLRASAAALLALQGKPVLQPKEALEQVAKEISPGLAEVLPLMSKAREEQQLPPGAGGPAVLKLIELSQKMHEQAEALKP